MKKNVLFIVVDSLCVDFLESKYGKMAAPFINSLNNTIRCKNMFSQGPFTEAGTKALLTGCNVLDDTGYMNRINDARSNVYKVFHENGYKTYALFYPDFLYGKELRKNIDGIFYTSRFSFQNLWDYKISYYADLYCEKKISAGQFRDLIDFLELLFDCWLSFLSFSCKDEYTLISKKANEEYYKTNFELLNKEYNLFLIDKIEYLKDLLAKRDRHPLFNVKTIDLNSDIDYNLLRNFISQNKKIINFCKKKHIRATFKKAKVKMIIKGLLDYFIHGFKLPNNEFSNFVKSVLIGNDFGKIERICDRKLVSSCRKQFGLIKKIIDNSDIKTPIFVSAHVEEPHYFNTFYSFDCNSKNYLDEEIKMQSDFIKKIQGDFDDSLEYLLSIRYIDFCVEDLFNFLKDKKIIDKYQIVITADHGTSYNFKPFRKNIVNNFHRENYHIPLILYDSDIKNTICENFYSSKDIVYSLYKYNMLKFENITGRYFFDDSNNDQNNYSIIEYMGPGCPDLRKKDIWIAIRDSNYLLSCKCPVEKELSKMDISEIYDLNSDIYEMNNLFNTDFDVSKIDYLFKILHKRHEQIRMGWINEKKL